MSDELLMIDLETAKWHNVTLRTEQQSTQSPAPAEEAVKDEEKEEVTVVTDEVFTMKLGGAATPSDPVVGGACAAARRRGGPSPRMSAMMCVQRSTLYLYGGVLERDDKQFYLSDMYSLDLHKLNEWKTIIEQPPLPDWLGSDSETEDSGSDSDSEDSEDTDEE